MRNLLLCLLLPAFILGADPVFWQHTEGTQVQYLTLLGNHACVQAADGTGGGSILLPDGDGQAFYRLGKPAGIRIVRTPDTVTLVGADGIRTVFTPSPQPPETIGWQPYVLPPTQVDAAKRKLVADELVKRFATEQDLRATAMRLSQGRMSQEAMAKPEVQKAWDKINATDEDNRLWLERTLRSDGWIGRKSHGDKAHEALLLISLHNVQHLRFSATILEHMRGEQQRGEIGEMSVANISDRLALVLGDPLSYGIQGTADATGKPVIPVIADGERLEANRARIGVGSMASAVAMMGAKVLRIGEDGRLVGEGVINARGLDAVDGQRALREPAWGLEAVATADPVLGAAISAGKTGDSKPITAWTRSANLAHLSLVAQVLMAQGAVPGTDSEAAVVALRPLFDGMLAGLPAAADGLKVMMANALAYSLVARATPPSAEELARAGVLGDQLDTAVQRPEVARSPNGHGIVDTVACIRFLQGDRGKAAGLWKRALELAGAQVPEVYRRRLAAAEAVTPGIALPR